MQAIANINSKALVKVIAEVDFPVKPANLSPAQICFHAIAEINLRKLQPRIFGEMEVGKLGNCWLNAQWLALKLKPFICTKCRAIAK